MPSGLVYPMSMHTIITKLYVSKLNENKEQIPTKIHVKPIRQQYFPKNCCPTLLVGVTILLWY